MSMDRSDKPKAGECVSYDPERDQRDWPSAARDEVERLRGERDAMRLPRGGARMTILAIRELLGLPGTADVASSVDALRAERNTARAELATARDQLDETQDALRWLANAVDSGSIEAVDKALLTARVVLDLPAQRLTPAQPQECKTCGGKKHVRKGPLRAFSGWVPCPDCRPTCDGSGTHKP